jgi:hypothetical protein
MIGALPITSAQTVRSVVKEVADLIANSDKVNYLSSIARYSGYWSHYWPYPIAHNRGFMDESIGNFIKSLFAIEIGSSVRQ